MSAKIHAPIVLLFLLAAACERPPEPSAPEKQSDGRIIACKCDENQVEFIKAEFNDVKMCFGNRQAALGLFPNAHIFNSLGQDQLNMIRNNKDTTFSAAIYLMSSRIHQRSLPYTIPRSNSDVNERANLQLLDMKYPGTSQCLFCATDDHNYASQPPNNLKLTIVDTTGGYLKGSFEGMIYTRTGKELTVKNGQFNIKITRVERI